MPPEEPVCIDIHASICVLRTKVKSVSQAVRMWRMLKCARESAHQKRLIYDMSSKMRTVIPR